MKVYQVLEPKVKEKKVQAESPMEAAKTVAWLKHESGSSLKEFKVELSRKNKVYVYNVKLSVTKDGVKINAIKMKKKQTGGGNCLPKMLCKNNHYSEARAASVEEIVESHKDTMQPVILNEESNFVVVTYWWGKGNLNRNTQRPCPEDLKPGAQLSTQPIRYEVMINRWIEMCKKVGCNYLVEEFPEFAKPGMYQHAINAKPLFIKAALDACSKGKSYKTLEGEKTGEYGIDTNNQNEKIVYEQGKVLEIDASLSSNNSTKSRAVLYIDGDMLIKKYPALFDIENVDFMARGWNIDPRSSDNYQNVEYICYDQYVFETSGGTMYFGNTKGAREILDVWHLTSSQPINSGKADDRILSLVFNDYAMLVKYNVIQLPIEYLWLTDIYGTKDDKPWGHVDHEHYVEAIIEHPACLTGEERATDQGAAFDRQPDGYAEKIDEQNKCNRIYGKWYPDVFFADLPNEPININTQPAVQSINPRVAASATFAKYIKYLSEEAQVEHDHDQFPITTQTEQDIANMTTLIKTNTQGLADIGTISTSNRQLPIAIVYKNEDIEISQILGHLVKGTDVIYVPESTVTNCDGIMRRMIESLIESCSDMEFVGYNVAKEKPNHMHLYQPFLSRKCPLFFSHSSRVLRYLLAMSTKIYNSTLNPQERSSTLTSIFNSSHVFISRIRCKWLDPNNYDYTRMVIARRVRSHYIDIQEDDF